MVARIVGASNEFVVDLDNEKDILEKVTPVLAPFDGSKVLLIANSMLVNEKTCIKCSFCRGQFSGDNCYCVHESNTIVLKDRFQFKQVYGNDLACYYFIKRD